MRKIGELPGSWRARHDRIPPELVKALYAKVQELAAKDSSPVKIARRLSELFSFSLSPGTVRHWMVGDRKPQGSNVFRNVFKEAPSAALSYIIGANKGDGCTLAKSGMVKLEVTDKDFAQEFNANMAILFSREKSNKIFVRRRADRLPMFIVKYSSRQLVQLLRQPLRKLLEIASAFPCEFLRGFFDAEGHVDVAAAREFQLHMGVENSSKELLNGMRRILKESFGIKSRIYRKRKAGTSKIIRGKQFTMRKTSFALVINKMEDVESFAGQIGFAISRKNQKLDDALTVIRTCPYKNRSLAWKRLYAKVRGEWTRLEYGLASSKVLRIHSRPLIGPGR